MSASIILSGSWSVYDDYKASIAQNATIFQPNDIFEVRFLTEKIRVLYPQYTDVVIGLSIHQVNRTLYAGCSRNLFVQLVMENLLQRKPLYDL